MNKNISLCLLIASIFILDAKYAAASPIDITFGASSTSITIGEEVTLSLTSILNPTHAGEGFVWQDLLFSSGVSGQTIKFDGELPDGTTRIDNNFTFSYDAAGEYWATITGSLFGGYTVIEEVRTLRTDVRKSNQYDVRIQELYQEYEYKINKQIQISVGSLVQQNLPVENIPIITNLPIISGNLPAVSTSLITNQPISSSSVPEPESIWLLISGLLSMALGGRRKTSII